tara:strand:- start:240 stop:365 length:126 start_codon:yes stop_codon:yes gene_type:complete
MLEELLIMVGAGLVFAFGGMLCFGVLIGIGELLEWYDRRNK